MQMFKNLLNPEWWRFEWRYWIGKTPWDTHITPPEVIEYINQNKPGRALDLGCGTGTNAITLTRHGWQCVGVDFSTKAIISARKKAAEQKMKIEFHVGDVSNLHFLSESFDYILDIGCLFSLQLAQQTSYAAEISRLARSHADFMLYAWLPRQRRGRQWGISVEKVGELFNPSFSLVRMVKGTDGPGASAWYWFKRF